MTNAMDSRDELAMAESNYAYSKMIDWLRETLASCERVPSETEMAKALQNSKQRFQEFVVPKIEKLSQGFAMYELVKSLFSFNLNYKQLYKELRLILMSTTTSDIIL